MVLERCRPQLMVSFRESKVIVHEIVGRRKSGMQTKRGGQWYNEWTMLQLNGPKALGKGSSGACSCWNVQNPRWSTICYRDGERGARRDDG